MNIHIRKIALAFVAIGMVITSAAAFAAPATSKASLNVRTGPGTSYNVIDTLYRGELVEVTECVSNGWCRIEHSGPDGWVSARYLKPVTNGASGSSGGGSGSGSGGSSDPDCSFGITIGPGGPSFSLSCGDAPPPPAPPLPPPTPVVQSACLYKGNNYTGSENCQLVGTVRPTIPASWNNAISSVKLTGGAKIRLCQGANFTGLCSVYATDKAILGSALNNKVSSYEIFTGSPSTPPPSPVASKVCFYKGNNFTGATACANNPFTRAAVTPAWNNKISSFKVYGGAKVKLCQGVNFTGLCNTYSNSVAVLDSSLNNKISSYKVFSGAIPPAPLPIPVTPVTFSTGPINLQQTWSADLDTGNVGSAGADIWYQAVTAVNKFITPRNGAKLSISGPTNRGYAGCSTASYSANKISIWTMPIGTYVCVKTNEGRISEFRLNGYAGTTMKLGYTTWAN